MNEIFLPCILIEDDKQFKKMEFNRYEAWKKSFKKAKMDYRAFKCVECIWGYLGEYLQKKMDVVFCKQKKATYSVAGG